MITGGNTGLGYHTAEELTRRGASSVILACRSIARGEEAAAQIKKLTGSNNVQVIPLDLGSFQSIHNFAQIIKEKFPNIDCLVCNAGIWVPMEKQVKTEDGLEGHVGINHLGHFLLTNLLIGNVQRVVVVSSGLMLSGKIDLEDSRQFLDGRKIHDGDHVPKHAPIGYCDSKLMNAVFARELASRHAVMLQSKIKLAHAGKFSVSRNWKSFVLDQAGARRNWLETLGCHGSKRF